MGLGISWKKAAIISAVVHLVALFIAVIFFRSGSSDSRNGNL